MTTPTVVVVGNGLIGSAAARRLADRGADVVVVGPSEPQDHATHDGVFSSHYDEGRLVSVHQDDRTWSTIARRSTDAFAELEQRSGVRFHLPVGRLSVVASSDVDTVRSRIERDGPDRRSLRVWPGADPSWRDRFPFLEVPDGFGLVSEGPPAGVINPRAMLRAENLVAQQAGARFLDDRVVSLASRSAGVVATTAGGETIRADRAVLAAGAFTNFADLAPAPVPLRLKTETTIRAAVNDATARGLATMPAITYDIDDDDIDDVYLAPPLRYPDGVHRIKMGCNTANETWPAGLAEVLEWFRHGDSDRDLEPMERALRSLVPRVELFDVTTHRCIVSYTPSGYPTIDHAPGDEHRRIVVAVGGNGTGAQGADALGEIAAGLAVDDRWPDDIERGVFRVGQDWNARVDRLSNAQRRARERQPGDTA